jgi:phage baseplate assembly protein W
MRGTNARTGKILSGLAHLRQSIRDILTTPLGSRVMRRNYGSRLFDLVDNPLNEQTLVDLFAATAEALIRWEPRLQVTRVQARRFTAEDASVPSAPIQIGPPGIMIGGTLTPNATGFLPRIADIDGKPAYGVGDATTVFPSIIVQWQAATSTSGRWVMGYYPNISGGSAWTTGIREFALQPTPNLAPDWAPAVAIGDGAVPTGTPIITEAAPPVATASVPQNSRAGSIVIDLEAIYLPTGQPVFLDGIVI